MDAFGMVVRFVMRVLKLILYFGKTRLREINREMSSRSGILENTVGKLLEFGNMN